MKKILGLLVGGLLLATIASANSIYLSCTTAEGANGASTMASTEIFCPEFTPPVGDSLISVQIDFENTFDNGVHSTTNSFNFVYSSILAGLGVPGNTYTDTVSGTTASSTFSDTANWGGSGGYYTPGLTNPMTTGLSAFLGNGVFEVAFVDATHNSGSLTGSGQLSSALFITYTYGLTQPEPMTMVLAGGGLLGLGLLSRKRRKKA